MTPKRGLSLDRGVFAEVLKSRPVMDELRRRAEAVAERAGGEDLGFKVTELVLEEPRGAVSVMATGKAAGINRRQNSLLKALSAAKT